MPIHEYHCKSCLREFEELVFNDESPACPHCHSSNTEKLLSRPCRCAGSGDGGSGDGGFGGASSGGSGGGCSGCSGGSCSSCGH